MERRDILTGDTRLYYFVNNAQGTPVLIVDSTNNDAVSRINLDEYGNIGSMIGAKEEINFTGKKMDLKTGLYYFNQRYYDPELGRFMQEDPAAQGPNLYQYCGNNPLMYTDPDGRLFLFDDILIGVAIAALQAGATSAAINAAAQYVMTGSINTQSVWNSFGSGALSGALSFGVGEMMGHLTKGLGKDLAHGVSGGLQSMAGGGSFGSGFVGGYVGNMAGEASAGMGMLESAGIAGLASGTTSWASGGNFATGFQAGAGNVLWNTNGKGLVDSGKQMAGDFTKGVEGFVKGLKFSTGAQVSLSVASLDYTIGKGGGISVEANPTIGASVFFNLAPEGMEVSQTVSYGISKHLAVSILSGKVNSKRTFGLGLNFGAGLALLGPVSYSQGL